jgi:hypothetical protein
MRVRIWSLMVVFLSAAQLGGVAQNSPEDLDSFWAEVSRTVGEGDFEGYSATYHPDAVLVNALSESSYPIADALAGWKQGFVDTAAGRVSAAVVFRFTQRLSDEKTAHETGIFRYSAQTGDAEPSVSFIHFEALLVNKDGWQMVMEFQKAVATQAEWDAAE